MDDDLGEKFNSVSRVHAVLSKARSANSRSSCISVWLNIFDIDAPDSDSDFLVNDFNDLDRAFDRAASDSDHKQKHRNSLVSHYRVFHFVGLFYDEVCLAHDTLRSTELPPSKYEGVFSSIYSLFDLHHIKGSWPSGVVDMRLLDVLDLLSVYVPSDDVRLDEDELSNIKSRISDLEEHVRSNNFSRDVERFFLNQLRIMSDAIREYHICGTKAFHSAIARGGGEAVHYRLYQGSLDEVDNEEVANAWSKIKDLWVWCSERAGEAAKIYGLFEIFNNHLLK